MKYGSSSETRQKIKLTVEQNALLFLLNSGTSVKSPKQWADNRSCHCWEEKWMLQPQGNHSPALWSSWSSSGQAPPHMPEAAHCMHWSPQHISGRELAGTPHNASFGLSFSTWGTLRNRSPFLSLILATGWLLMHWCKGIDFNSRFQAAVCKQSNFLHTSDQEDSSGTGRARTGPVQQEETEYCYFK